MTVPRNNLLKWDEFWVTSLYGIVFFLVPWRPKIFSSCIGFGSPGGQKFYYDNDCDDHRDKFFVLPETQILLSSQVGVILGLQVNKNFFIFNNMMIKMV